MARAAEAKWVIKNKKADFKALAKALDIPLLLGKLLVNREIVEVSDAQRFLQPDLSRLHSPYQMKDMDRVSDLLLEKIQTGKRIRVIGDYDVDGVISTYILTGALQRLKAQVDYQIPHRVKEGYGINESIIREAKQDGVDTLLTCDNGISALGPVGLAKELGMTVIVTDHHDLSFTEEAGERAYVLPPADGILNPKQPDCSYPFERLCGAAVAFKLIQALYEKSGLPRYTAEEWVEYVAIATICDVVDLVDENRILVAEGLKRLSSTSNLGLKALMRVSGIEGKPLSVYHMGYIIGPCINASGRLDHAEKGLHLLQCRRESEAARLAEELHQLNQSRKAMTQTGVERAIQLIEESSLKDDKILVIYLPGIHESLAGIIAGRIKERYHAPTLVLTDSEEGVKGSGRSIEAYNLFEGLLACKELLHKFGGHPMAAGLSMAREQVEPLRERLNQQTTLTDEEMAVKIQLDVSLPLDGVDLTMVNQIKRLEPFGKGNPKPLFGEKNVRLIRGTPLGKNRNVLKLRLLTARGRELEAIHFGDLAQFEAQLAQKYGTHAVPALYQGQSPGAAGGLLVDIAYYPDVDEYRGVKSLSIVIEGMR